MKKTEKVLEYRALREFISLVDEETSLATRVRHVIHEELTDRQQQMVTMYYIEGLSMREIADNVGISVSTVSRTISRGRCRIRKYLKYNGRAMMNTFTEY